MKNSTRLILAVTLVGSLGFGGLVRNVYAAQSQSIQLAQASDGDGEVDDDLEEQQETAKLQSLAKITLQQAQQAAETASAGKASSIELENEDGNLVYEVTISQKEVIVDAGDGRVLYTEDANQEDEKNEASHPKSSIQVPDDEGGANDYGAGQQGGWKKVN